MNISADHTVRAGHSVRARLYVLWNSKGKTRRREESFSFSNEGGSRKDGIEDGRSLPIGGVASGRRNR